MSNEQTTHGLANDPAFFDDNFTPPSGGGGRFFKPQDGLNKVRIVRPPVHGFLAWERGEENKPHRCRFSDKDGAARLRTIAERNEKVDDRKVKYFVAFIVWNYATEQLEVWEVTQGSIIDSVKALAKDPEWGVPYHPTEGYGHGVMKKGSGMNTKYEVNPGKAVPIREEWLKGIDEINLEALFEEGGNVFPPVGGDNSPQDDWGGGASDDEDESDIPY